jgi:hypothetical protein
MSGDAIVPGSSAHRAELNRKTDVRRRAQALVGAPLALAVTGAAAVFLAVELIHDVGTKAYFEDEAVAGLVASRPWGELLHTVVWTRGGSPLHFILAHIALDISPTVGSLRWLSIVFALGAVICAYALARHLAGEAAGAAAAWITAGSSLLRVYGTFGRMYSLLAFLGGLNMLLFVRALERPTRLRVTLAAVSAWLLAATHPFAIVPVAVEAGIALWYWRGRDWRGAIPALIVAAATLPLLAGELRLAGRFDVSTSDGTAIGSGGDASRQLREAIEGFAGGRGAALVILTALAVAGIWFVVQRSPQLILVGASALLIPPVLSLIAHVGNTSTAYLTPRHLMAALVLWAALIGVGVVQLIRTWRVTRRLAAVAVLVAAILATSAPATARDPRTWTAFWTTIGSVQKTTTVGTWLGKRIQPGDLLFPYAVPYLRALPQARKARTLPRGDAPTLLAAIGDGHGARELWVTLPLGPHDVLRPAALRALRRSYEVTVFSRWFVIRVPGPFANRRAAITSLAPVVDEASAAISKGLLDSAAYEAVSTSTVNQALRIVNRGR